MLERLRQRLPPLTRYASGPRDEGVDGERNGQLRQRSEDVGSAGLAQRPALHHAVERDPAGMQLRAPAQPDPAIQDDEDDQGDEQHALNRGDDDQELTARHLPTQRLIFSSATRRLIGFTR